MKYEVFVKGTIDVEAKLLVDASSDGEAESKVLCALGARNSDKFEFDQLVVDQVLEAWKDDISETMRDADDTFTVDADVVAKRLPDGDEEPCRDCGVPCSHEKDGEGFHA